MATNNIKSDPCNELVSSRKHTAEILAGYDPQTVTNSYETESIYPVIDFKNHRCHISSMNEYMSMYERSLRDTDGFWGELAIRNLRWLSPFTKVHAGGLLDTDYAWFLNGKLNACDNCVDRWYESKPDALALIYEGDEEDNPRRYTFKQLKDSVCRIANVLKSVGVKKGDIVTIYMPNIPELVFSVLACCRIGAIHSVVFGGFSANSLAERIHDAKSTFILTVDEGLRGGKHIKMKDIVDEALANCPLVKACLVYKNTGAVVNMKESRDIWLSDAMLHVRPYCPMEVMDSEDILFLLYTSGSTGKPKGVAHSTAGYLLYALTTTRYIFDAHEGDIFGCMADVGWITGHSYIIYGPLLNGLTTFVFGSLPTYPDPGRYWRMIQRYKITQFYTAPTAIRSLMRFGDEYPSKYDTSSLRVLGSVGEPINPEAWRWYYTVVGKNKAQVIDTYWQTETGGIVIAPIPGVVQTKPGSATFPFFGIDAAIVDPTSGNELHGNDVSGFLLFRQSWPGMFRTVFADHQRGVETYFSTLPGYYLTGDAAYRDKDGYIWISGRIDDTINVSGHRICSAEIEHALVSVKDIVAEAAVVGYPHKIKGQGIFCFVTLKNCALNIDSNEIVTILKKSARSVVGPFATPDVICLAPNLPKTRSGKIMRRILRKLVHGQYDNLGDVSTLADVTILSDLITAVKDSLTSSC